MRKYLLIIITIILFIICIALATCGLKLGNFKIYSYKDIKTLSMQRNAELNELDQKNMKEFSEKKEKLTTLVEDYKIKKSEYDELVNQGKISESAIYSSMDIYNIDFLHATLGNYATKNEVTLQLDVTKSATSASISADYIMCDLSFNITGEYISITDFIYNIEDDDNLNFEISNFAIEKGGENLQATFVVKGVLLNSQNLSSVPISPITAYEETTN